MPIPILLGLAAAGAALVGIGAQAEANDTNAKASSIAEQAQQLYYRSKRELEEAKAYTEATLIQFGSTKKEVLETSFKQFSIAFSRIKNIELRNTQGLNEIRNFIIDKQDAIQLIELSNIYESSLSSGAAGAATGTIIALAASGSLPIVTGALSSAGAALITGQVGVAAGLAGSAFSIGAAMTPLAAIAAPAVLFSGISASLKADENLEKAQVMYAEAEVATEEMKNSEVLCKAIAERSNMLNDLLVNLNTLFSYCAALLDGVTRKKEGFFRNKMVDATLFNEEELKLLAVTRALAGAVKAIIDTPILTPEGKLTEDSFHVAYKTLNTKSTFVSEVNKIAVTKYNAKPIYKKQKNNSRVTTKEDVMNGSSVIVGLVIFAFITYYLGHHYAFGALGGAIGTSLMLEINVDGSPFEIIKHISRLTMAASICTIFYLYSSVILELKYSIIASLIIIPILVIIGADIMPSSDKPKTRVRCTAIRVIVSICFFGVAFLAYAVQYKFLGLTQSSSTTISLIICAILELLCVYAYY